MYSKRTQKRRGGAPKQNGLWQRGKYYASINNISDRAERKE